MKNNKRMTALVFILVICAFLLIFEKFIPALSFHLGLSNYNKGNYEIAYKDFKVAVAANPTNRDYRYYFVKTMLNLPPTLEIQKDIFSVSEKNQPDSADLIADRQVDTWKNKIIQSIGENYIQQAPFNDKILRWDAAKFPISVFIKTETTVPAYYKSQIQRAFVQWQIATSDFLKFRFVNTPEGANIIADVIPSDKMKKCTQDDCKYTTAYTTPVLSGEYLKHSEINFYAKDTFGNPFSQKEIYNTALHEAGHALGIMGHSFNPDDVMFMENNANKISEKYDSEFRTLSTQDVNTIMLLYKLIPDITNTRSDKFDTRHQIYAPIILGDEKQINSRKLLEAENYVHGAPDVPNGYIDMAAAYSDNAQYNNATQALYKALDLCSNDNERYVVYYNFAVIYMKIKDWDAAIKYAQLAKQANPAADIDGMIAMFQFNLGHKADAIETYKLAITRHPEDILNSVNLATIYLRQFNFVQAGKVLHEFVKANPDQASDARIRRYSILMFFFR